MQPAQGHLRRDFEYEIEYLDVLGVFNLNEGNTSFYSY